MKRLIVSILMLLVSTFSIAKPLVVGIVPQYAASKIVSQWRPLLDVLSEQTGVQFELRTAKTIPEFEQRLAEGQYDIAYMNPYHFITFNVEPGYKALAHQKKKKIHGIIVASVGDSLTLDDLEGEQLAFPSPAAFAASILPRATMTQKGINFTPIYVGSHDSSFLAVSKGFFKAGGGVVRTFKALPEETKSQLKIIWKSPGYTPHAIAYHPRVDPQTIDTLVKALVTLSDSEEGLNALTTLGFQDGFKQVTDESWDDIRELMTGTIGM
ncbi:phosphate/phosphite/phosphonate ABC transporter substrate-binding protein [Vibrio atypicus]|uniref:phosphate/phosphite/phosphonate ABC transporter substrate-binding protein n=1 Tax=Vibrio atypicus TaxID=558271 RepID=UPI0015768824|nr:phosphate/phosphite/phosphonate ABC transporter substrate-binding protein [Vibrio atypicus]